MGSKKAIAYGFFWTSLLNIVNALYGFISVPLLIAYYGGEDYGLIGLAMSVNVYLRLMDLGFTSTNVRYFSEWRVSGKINKLKTLFSSSLALYGVIGLINAIVLLILAYFSSELFHLDGNKDIILKQLFYILSISAFISWYTNCFDQIIRSYEFVGWTQKILLIPKIMQILILMYTYLYGLDIVSYYAFTTFSTLIVLPFSIIKIQKICPIISFIPKWNGKIIKEILPYSIGIFSFSFFQFSVNYLRPVFLGMRDTLESVTDYRVLNGIGTFVVMIGGAFLPLILPSAAKVVSLGDIAAQHKIAYKGTKYISILLSFLCFLIISVSPQVLTIYVGKTYLSLTIWLDLWLLTTLATHNQAISSLILAGTKIKAITYITIISCIIGMILCWILIPYYSVGSTVISYGIYLLIQLLFYYLYYWPRILKLNSRLIFSKSFIPYVIIGAVIAITLRLLDFNISDWSTLIIKSMLFCILFVFSAYFLLTSEDKRFFISLISKVNKNN